MASGNYSADMDRILRGSAGLRDAVRFSDRMLPEFLEQVEETFGWWGDERGDGDLVRQVVGPQCGKEHEGVLRTLAAITSGFTALVDAVADEAVNVKRPQGDALDQIHDEAARVA